MSFCLSKLTKIRPRFFLRIGIIFLIFGVTACSHSGTKNSQKGDPQAGYPPIYVVNGRVMSKDSARYIIPRLKSKYIQSLRVVDGKKAALLFGKKARGGAIEYKIPNKKKAFSDLSEMSRADSLEYLAQKNSEKIYNVADQEPEIISGLRKLQQKVKYPPKCKQARIEGRVLVQVVVNKQGFPENPKVIKGLGYGCDKEAIRVVKSARFIPGKINGKPVTVKFYLPIIFSLKNQ